MSPASTSEPAPERHWSAAKVRALALRSLTLRPLTQAELTRRLVRKSVPEELIEPIVRELTEVGLIDDAAYARLWVQSRQHGKALAANRLRRELHARGVDEVLVESALDGLDPGVQEQAARSLVARRLAVMDRLDPGAQTRRLVGVLSRKGYAPAFAYRVVREVMAARRAQEGSTYP